MSNWTSAEWPSSETWPPLASGETTLVTTDWPETACSTSLTAARNAASLMS